VLASNFHTSDRPVISPPTSTTGNAVGAAAVLAAGTALGATIGYAVSPAPPSNKAVGAIEGGTLGVLLTAFGGLLSPYYAPRWKRLGQTAGIIGVGAVAAMAAIGAARSAQAATPPALPSSTAATSLAPGGVYEIASQVPSGVQDANTLASQLVNVGWGTPVVLFFGPTTPSSGVPPEMRSLMQSMNAPTSYVARGTWNGASQPVPAGLVALKVG
jgi:hypothetical protein